MLQGLQEAEFPLGRPLDHHPLFLVGLGLNQVDADAAERVLERDVLAEEILVARAFINDALQFVIAHAAAALRGPDADLFERTADGLGHRAVEGATRLFRQARDIRGV